MWEVDIGKEWRATQHQAAGKQVASDPLERNATRNTARSWLGGSGDHERTGGLPDET